MKKKRQQKKPRQSAVVREPDNLVEKILTLVEGEHPEEQIVITFRAAVEVYKRARDSMGYNHDPRLNGYNKNPKQLVRDIEQAMGIETQKTGKALWELTGPAVGSFVSERAIRR